ncbi:MAG: TPM domain-containing protein [Betaproteobacteria bacterium]
MSALIARVRVGALLGFAAAWLAASPPALAADVPYLTGRVVDNANILSAGAKEKITQLAAAREQANGDQIAVLTMPSLEGESIEGFATKVFEAWKLGKKGQDNGVLVIVAPNDRKMRIEVGYGLEGTLTDAASARIIREAITPKFKANDFDGGLTAGVQAIVDTLEGKGDWGSAGAAPESSSSSKSGFASIEDQLPPWPMRILLGAFIFGIIGLFTFLGVMTPGMGWFLYFFLIPFWAMFPIIILGVKGAMILLGIYVVGFPVAKLIVSRQPWYAKAAQEMKTKGSTTIGGMVVSSRSGGSSGGGFSSGGGGFSGGGGSSGGGGASGSW